ncbi:hypothetical protein P152DRAFT_472372 [Eremomyces bilateralis CBS 781.70]|uniref:Uncharacterized protein n=1 Tax=Eremomyces bilateralis CBS 781.70 TaxID=1392243 RepID=A0A6G1G9Q3_9PEZI|nr:uncharacterized protein P152DRAFT_472372 [Eremomyces bilateralis CBS 781.70]KAF1814631.1 hypothetical protein P152DRAFT_472372 [Eremomyces bilateralis CBS 781.70]
MSTSTDQILRVDRSDKESLTSEENDYVLFKVSRDDGTPSSLGVSLTATEGLAVFVGRIVPSRIRSIKAPNYRGSDENLEVAVRHCVLEEPIPPQHAETLAGLEIVAYKSSVNKNAAEEQLHVVIRQQVSGIVQRLATIELAPSDEEVDILSWTATAVQSAHRFRAESATLTAQLQAQLTRAETLQTELEALLSRKRDDEDAMLLKFAALLNSKKLKIREMQRAMALRPHAAPGIKSDESPPPDNSDHKPPRPKRKPPTQSPSPSSSSDFESMPLPRPASPSHSNDDTSTQPPSDTDTATASDHEPESSPPKTRKLGRVGGGKRSPIPAANQGRNAASPPATRRSRRQQSKEPSPSVTTARRSQRTRASQVDEEGDGDEMEVEVEMPPPRRELPHRRGVVERTDERVGEEGSETEDEL